MSSLLPPSSVGSHDPRGAIIKGEMRKEAEKWLRQAEGDLKAAGDSLKDENFDWACFQSQQAAEKVLKAYLYNLGYTTIHSHSVRVLLGQSIQKGAPLSPFDEIARFLDNFYIPTRYPNGLDEDLAPVEYYDRKDAQKCVESATSILTAAKKFIKS